MVDRVQRKRTRGSKLPPNTKYVGRPTEHGNSFTGENAYDLFDKLIRTAIAENAEWLPEYIDKLRGYDHLACWCALDTPCHADVLVRVLNKELI